jgi:DNA-binding MarR family transcriptional regulator
MAKKIMNLSRSQIVINLPPQSMEEIDTIMQRLGFTSRGQYFMFLHHALKTSIELTYPEKNILMHLGEWGIKSFQETPDIAMLAKRSQYDEGTVRKTLESLKLRSLLAELAIADGKFQFDVKINKEKRYQLTATGRAAARAALLLCSQFLLEPTT